jgi:Cu+-exporting ATPase
VTCVTRRRFARRQFRAVQAQPLISVKCFHCGDPCQADHLRFDDKDFCCQGCQAVYGLLQESGLCDYYALGDKPGVKEESGPEEMRGELFDLPEVREKLVEFSEDGITRVTLNIPQMHCSSCIWLLENLQRVEPAIIRSRVRFPDKEVSITFREDRLSLRALVELMRRIGYPPRMSGSGRQERKRGAGVPRLLYVKLGVAAFAFGNIMLFSFPEYLGADASDALLRKGFQALSFVFSLPVLLFSSTDFFKSAWAGLRTRQVNIDQPIALGIVALFLRSAFDVLLGAGPGYFDSLAGLVFFLLVGRWYQAYTYQALSFDRALNDLLPLVVIRKDALGNEQPAGVADLRPGDTIVLRDQELIPVDGVLRAGKASIDNSFITGEPMPVARAIGDAIRAGGRQRGGAIELEVLRPFEQSNLKRLWEEQAAHGAQRPAMPRMIDAVARRFTIAVILIATAAGIYWAGRDAGQVWPVVTAVLIVACPCALALSMPFAYGHTMRLLGRRGIFLRDAEVVERMAHVDCVVFDKTGTLTAREAYDLRWHGPALTADEEQRVRSLARNSAHTLSAALHQGLAGKVTGAVEVEEVPGAGISGTVRGMAVRIGSAAFTGGRPVEAGPGEAQVHVSIAGSHRGRFTVRKRMRSGMEEAVAGMEGTAGTVLLTGDRQVDPEVARLFDADAVSIGCTPLDKAERVKELRARGRHVMMVGDGLNDAGALAGSDVGVAVAETTAALTPACDAILDARHLRQLPNALRLARRARTVVFMSLGLSLLYNVTGVGFAVSGRLTPLIAAILMPLSSVTVVGFVTLATWLASRRLTSVADESHAAQVSSITKQV